MYCPSQTYYRITLDRYTEFGPFPSFNWNDSYPQIWVAYDHNLMRNGAENGNNRLWRNINQSGINPSEMMLGSCSYGWLSSPMSAANAHVDRWPVMWGDTSVHVTVSPRVVEIRNMWDGNPRDWYKTRPFGQDTYDEGLSLLMGGDGTVFWR